MIFKNILKLVPDETEYIVKLIKYCKNIKIPVTLIEIKNAVEILRIIKLFEVTFSFCIKFSKTLKLKQVHTTHIAMNGTSFGLNSDCPNK